MSNGGNGGFNEAKARDLVYELLNNDTNIFKKLIPEIRAMDSDSFENLFMGTPFKSPENPRGYDYKVKNEKPFERLLDKFDNFWVILDEWYFDEKYLEYLKKLWTNYICIQNLQNKDDKKLELLLNSYEIDYKNWPEDIKSSFKRIINSTKKTRIFHPKKVEEVEEERSEFRVLLKKLNKFKETIEAEPEMEIYENNTNIIINKLKYFIELVKKNGKKWCCGKTGIFSSILGTSSLFIPFIGMSVPIEQNILEDNNYSDDEFDNDIDNDIDNDENSDNFNLEELAEKAFNSNLFCFAYVALSFLHLGWSAYEFYQSYKDLKQINEKIKVYNEKLEKIKKRFNEHKDKIGILPNDSKESLKIIEKVLIEISEDYNELKDLINEIHESIKIANEYKNKSTLGLISSGILGICGIAGGILIRNPNTIWFGIGTASNALSAFGHTITIIESKEIIEDLNDILKRANQQKKEIKDQINNLIKIVLDMEKGLLPKFGENQFNEKKNKKI